MQRIWLQEELKMIASLHPNLSDIQNPAWQFWLRVFWSFSSSKFCYCQVKITTPLSGWKICQFVTYDEVLLMSSIQLLCWVASAANRFCRPILWWPSFTEFSGPKPTQEAIVGPINTTHISNRHYTVEKTITHV